MPTARKILKLLSLLLGWMLTAAADGQEPPLRVQVLSGRVFSGVMDGSSNREQLVIRTTLGGVTLDRSLRWERIAAATLDGKATEVPALKALALKAEARTQGTGERGKEPRVKTIELRGPASPPQPPATTPGPPARPAQQVVSMAFDAALANWDGDVETDGLALDVAPIDSANYLVPADATVQVELFAPQRRILADAPQSGGDTLELVERWTREITPEDYTPSGAKLRLPFGAIHPEIDSDWAASWYGLVHVRLVVPGQGVFDDSRDGVRIRPWAPNRDNLEMNTGRRFLPTERLGRHD